GEPMRHQPWFHLDDLRRVRVVELFYAAVAILAATLFIEVVNYFIPEAFGALLRNRRAAYLIAAAFVAGRYGWIPGLVAAVIGYVTMNFIYVDPSLKGLLDTPADIVDFGLFIFAAVLIGLLVNRNRVTNEERDEQMRRMQALFRMYHVSLRAHT